MLNKLTEAIEKALAVEFKPVEDGIKDIDKAADKEVKKEIKEAALPYAEGTTPNDLDNIWVLRGWLDNMDSEDGNDNMEFTKIGLIGYINDEYRDYSSGDAVETDTIADEDISDEELMSLINDGGAPLPTEFKVIEIRPYSTGFNEELNKPVKNEEAQPEFKPVEDKIDDTELEAEVKKELKEEASHWEETNLVGCEAAIQFNTELKEVGGVEYSLIATIFRNTSEFTSPFGYEVYPENLGGQKLHMMSGDCTTVEEAVNGCLDAMKSLDDEYDFGLNEYDSIKPSAEDIKLISSQELKEATMNEGGGAGVEFVFDKSSNTGRNLRTEAVFDSEGLKINVYDLPIASYEDVKVVDKGGYILFNEEALKKEVVETYNQYDRLIYDPEIKVEDIKSIDSINAETIPNLMYSWGWIRVELPQDTVLTWKDKQPSGYLPELEVSFTLTNGEDKTARCVCVDGEYHISEDVFYAYQELDEYEEEEELEESVKETVEVTEEAEDEEPIKVVFRKIDGDVVALFPTEVIYGDGSIESYMHVGQHGPADRGAVEELEPATPEEYADLLAELKSVGYDNLIIEESMNEDKYLSDEDIAAQYDGFKCTNVEVKPSKVNEGWFNFTLELEFPDADHPDFSDYVIENGYYNSQDDVWGFDNWYPEATMEQLKQIVLKEVAKLQPKEEEEDYGKIEGIQRIDDKHMIALHHQTGKYMIHEIDEQAEDLIGNLIATKEFDTSDEALDWYNNRH